MIFYYYYYVSELLAVSRAMRGRGPLGHRVVLALVLLPPVLIATSLEKGEYPASCLLAL
jgi:hypothetical protein